MSVAAYKQTMRDVDSPRDIERRVISNITHSLEQQGVAYDAATTKIERQKLLANGLRDALLENQRFWLALRHDLATPENGLSLNLRGALISIALWVERETASVFAGESAVGPLVDVNRSIAAGLSGRAPQPQLAGG